MKSIVSMLAVASAVMVLGVRADDLDDLLGDTESDTTETSSASDEAGETVDEDDASAGEEVEDEGVDGEGTRKEPAELFHLLPFCRSLEGAAEVLIPGKTEWKAIEEGKYYPLGSTYRTTRPESRLKIVFGTDSSVELSGVGSFRTRKQKLAERVRVVELVAGTLLVRLPNQMPDGAFSISAPGFVVKNAVGESRYTYSTGVDGDEALIRCVTQKLTVEGPHFLAPALRAANEIKIRTNQDHLATVITGVRGDVLVQLDQGLVANHVFGTGGTKIEPKRLEWKLSPLTSIRIHRAKLSISGKMSVTTMTFDSSGELRNRCAFAEDMVEVNSGELGPTSKKDREDLARRAAEIARTQEAAGKASETRDAEIEDEEDDE